MPIPRKNLVPSVTPLKERILLLLAGDPENAYSVLEIAEKMDGAEPEMDVLIARILSDTQSQIPRYEKPLEELVKEGRIGAGFAGTRRFYFALGKGSKDARS